MHPACDLLVADESMAPFLDIEQVLLVLGTLEDLIFVWVGLAQFLVIINEPEEFLIPL